MEPAKKIIDLTKVFQGKAAKKVEGFWGNVKKVASKIRAFATNRWFMAFGHYIKKGILESVRLARLGKAKFEIFFTGRQVTKKHAELGKVCYKLMAEGKLSMPELNFLKSDLDGLEARLKEKKEHMEQIRSRRA